MAVELVRVSDQSRGVHARVVLVGHGDHVVCQAHAASVIESKAVPTPMTAKQAL